MDPCFERSARLTRFFYSPEHRSDETLCTQLRCADAWITQYVTAPLTDYQRQALLCLVADVECGLVETPGRVRLTQSFLLVALNRSMFQLAAAEFYDFCYVEGSFNVQAYQKRRAEHYLFTRNELIF